MEVCRFFLEKQVVKLMRELCVLVVCVSGRIGTRGGGVPVDINAS